MVYEMNDLKGILFLVLLKTISITSTNIDCSGNAFHCVNSTHFLICVDLGGGVSITIDDFIIPCPPATVCERNNRFECEYPKTTTTEYPLTVIGVTRQEVTEIARDGLSTVPSYVTELPEIYDSGPNTVTEGVTTLSNVVVLESVKLENDTNVKSASEITTISYSKIPDTQNDKNEINENLKIKTSTHASMSSPNDNLLNVESVIETVLDKPEIQSMDKEIVNGNITGNIYENISNKIKFASNYNETFNNEPKLNGQVVQESVNTLTVNEHQIDNGIQNDVNQNNIQKYPQELSGISNEKTANDMDITEHDPTTTMSDGLITLNFNSVPNTTNVDQSAITTATEYSVVKQARIVNKNSTETVLANDFTRSPTITEASLTEINLLIDQVTILPTEVTNNKDILSNKNQNLESVNQTDHKLNRKIYSTPSTERLASNLSVTENIMLNSDQSSPTTVIPLEITTFMSEDANLPISYENNKGALLANEFIPTETNLTESKNRIRTLASEPIYTQDLVLQNSSIKITEMYENAKDVTNPGDFWSSSVYETTTDHVPTENPIERYTTNSISTQNVTNYHQSFSPTTPSMTILLETNTFSIPHRNNVEMMTTEMIDIVTSNNQTNTLPTENVHVVNPFKEIDHKLKENNITVGFTDLTVHDNETTTEQIPSIITTEMFTIDSSNMQTMTNYDEPVTTATTTETNTNVFVTHSQRKKADEFITTMAAYTDRNLITEQVNIVLTDASNIQHIYKNPSDDLFNQSFQNNIHSEVMKNINDELLNTYKTTDIFFDQGLPTSSTEKSFEFIVNNAEQNYEPSSNNPPPVETTSVKLITEYHHETTGPIETRTFETNLITTTTEPYYTENISFTDHADKLFTEATNIEDVYSIKNPITEQINNSKLNPELKQDTKINVSLHYIDDSLLNEMSTIELDAPIPVLTKVMSISRVTQTNNGSRINISSTPSGKPVTVPIEDYSDVKPKDNVLVTTPKGIVTDNILFIDETNTLATEETYYKQTENPIIPVNQTNFNNLHHQMTTETSALIIEPLVNTTGTNGSLTSTNLTEYYNSSYYNKQKQHIIQQNITDRSQIANVSTVLAETIATPIIPIALQVNHTERTIAQNELDQKGTESITTLWRVKDITTNQTSIIGLATIGTDTVIEANLDTRGNIIDNYQNSSEIYSTIIPSTNITHTKVHKTEYNEKIPEETTETIFTESAIDKVYIETQVDMYQVVPNPIIESENLQQFQKIQYRFTNKKAKDVAKGIKNETSIESSPLTTTENVYNDFISETSTRLEDNKEMQTEKSNIAVIASTTQNTLQSDDISALSNIEIFNKFMTPSPMELITDKTNETAPKLNTDSTVEHIRNNTATLLSTVVEILNTSTATQFDTSTNKLTVDYLEEIVKTTEVNILEPNTDNTTPITQTAYPLEISENITKHSLVSTIPYFSTTIDSPTSISPSTEPNINNTSAINSNDIGVNVINTTLNTSTNENIADFQIDLSASYIVTELPIKEKYTTVNPIEVSLQVSSGLSDTVGSTLKFETVTETAATTIDISISSASSDKSSIQMSSLLHGNKQNNTNLKNKTSNNEMLDLKNIVIINEATDISILDSTINTSWVSTHINPNDHNITDQVLIGTENKPPVKELLTTLTDSSTSRLGDGTQNNVIYSDSSLTTEPQKILTLPALDIISTDSNQTINSLLNASIDGLSTGTSEPPEYSKITKNLDTEEIHLPNSTYGPTQDNSGLQISNKMETEIINHTNHSISKINSSELVHNQGDLKEPVRTGNNEHISVINNDKQLNNTINPLHTITNFVSTIPYPSTTINPSNSISSSKEPNINNTSAKTNSDLGINTSTTEHIGDFQTDLSASNIVTELPIKGKYTTANSVNVSLQVSSGLSDTLARTAAATTIDTSISSALRDSSTSSLLHGNKQNNTNLKNNTSNNEMLDLKKIVFVNEGTDNSILDSTINTSWISTHSNPNDHNITDKVFIGTENKPPVKELSSILTESSTSRLEEGAQNNEIHSESSLTTEPQQILTLSALDFISTDSNQAINSLLNASIDGLSTGTAESPEYSKITKNLDTEEILLTNSTYGPTQDDIGLQTLNEMRTAIMNHLNHSVIKVNSAELFHNQGDLKEPVSTANNENASEIYNNNHPNNTMNTSNTVVNFVSTIPYSSTTINPSTSISSPTEPNINNTSAKINSDLGINTATTENIADFQTDLSASNIVTELPIKGKYTTANSVNVSLQVSSGLSDTLARTAAATTIDTSISSALRDKSSIQMSSLLHGNKQNNTNLKNNNNEDKIVFVNVATDNSILNSTINTSLVSTHSNANDHNVTDKVFIGTENKPPVKELSSILTESSTSRLEEGAQNNEIHSESSLTTEPQQILTLSALDFISTDSNQAINSLLNASIDGLSTGTSESPEYSKITKNLDTEDFFLTNRTYSTYGPKQDDIGLLISKKMGSENMNHSNQSKMLVNLSEPLHNQGDLKEPLRTLNNENASESYDNKQPNNTTKTLNTKVNIPTNVTVNRNISDENIMNGFHFSCLNRSRGKYADNNDCRKFYICIGRPQPLAGTCPLNTVFSEINKQCTKNLSHCVRNNQFRCLLEGRFGDFFRDNVYYICIKSSFNKFMRYKLQCLNGFHLNKDTVVCEHNVEVSSSSSRSSVSENSQRSNDNSESTQNTRQNQEASKGKFECEREGKFPHPDNCRKYYVCSKNSKAEYRRKIKQCSSDEVFHNEKKKCIESESNGC